MLRLGLYLSVVLLLAAGNTSVFAQQSQPLQGGVRKVDLSLTKLRDVGLDLKRVMTAARHLYDEVTIQPVQMITEPEVIGRGMIIQIPVSTQPIGPPEPPRKDRVEMSMNDMTPVITTMKGNADAFVAGNSQLDLPEAVQTELQPQLKKWIDLVNNISGQLTNLQPLTKGPNYDNAAIAAVCKNMQKDASELDKVRRKVYKVIKKEDKLIKSEKTS